MNENTAALFAGNRTTLGDYRAKHFGWAVEQGVGTVTLNRPERKNPLTFESYAELRDLFRQLAYATDVKSIVLHGAGSGHRRNRLSRAGAICSSRCRPLPPAGNRR